MPRKEFESPLPHEVNNLKPVPVAGFKFSNYLSVKTVPKVFHYREPKLKRAKAGWYVEYYYRIPAEVRPAYDNKEWLRFRVKEDINRRKGEEKEVYATWLRSHISDSLKEGYNPFNVDQELIKVNAPVESEVNITDALNLFLSKWKDKGLDPKSYTKYKRYVDRLINWCKLKSIPYINVTEITQDHIEQFLSDMKTDHKFSNREYNNHFDFIRTAFNYLLSKKIIAESPCSGIVKQKTKSTKHRFYDKIALDQITKALKELDPYSYLAFQTVYHLCVRSDKELMNLKVGNIQWEQNRILAEVSKTDQRYIPMDETIKELLSEFVKDYPDEYFIFGAFGKPASQPFGAGFFAKKFRKVRDKAGMNNSFTLYGAKHTRIVHLKSDGVPDADIMNLTGHKSFESYSIYMRDLGLTADIKNINEKGRKV